MHCGRQFPRLCVCGGARCLEIACYPALQQTEHSCNIVRLDSSMMDPLLEDHCALNYVSSSSLWLVVPACLTNQFSSLPISCLPSVWGALRHFASPWWFYFPFLSVLSPQWCSSSFLLSHVLLFYSVSFATFQRCTVLTHCVHFTPLYLFFHSPFHLFNLAIL